MSNSKSMRIVRAAVIGGGAFGECHLKTYSCMPRVEVAGLYTLDRDRAAGLCQKYGGRAYSSLQELADDPTIELVSICTPEDLHFEPFKLLSERGKAIYCEKPLAVSLDQAREMVHLSKSIIAMCGHCLRFEARLAHVFARRAQLGQLRHMSFKNRRVRDQKTLYGRVHPAMVLLCHELELANAFAGAPFKRVCALNTRFSPGQIDGMSALVEYASGATCAVDGGWFLPGQTEENDQVVLDFEKGTYTILLPHTGILFLDENGYRFPNTHYEFTIYGNEFGALRSALEYMVNCIVRTEPPGISTIEDGYNAVRLVTAAIRSAETGQWVDGASV